MVPVGRLLGRGSRDVEGYSDHRWRAGRISVRTSASGPREVMSRAGNGRASSASWARKRLGRGWFVLRWQVFVLAVGYRSLAIAAARPTGERLQHGAAVGGIRQW